jgi:endonuclease/exonuclease/phosphatase family metal-dependent hydrolase
VVKIGFFLLLLVTAARGETLTIATYNIENYGPANRMTDAGYRKDYPKPEIEKQALRKVIRAIDADVIMLQEMGGPPYLEELRRDLKAAGIDYPHGAVAAGADEDRHVAVLSKRPLVRLTTHAELDFKYFGTKERVKRGLLEVAIATAAGEITLFGVHLKSRITDRADDPLSAVRRGAEATAVRDQVLKQFPVPTKARFVILGDCNDGKTSRVLAYLQKRGKTEIARLLPASDSRGEQWTHAFRREQTYSRVDQILVSPGLFSAVAGGAAKIFDGEGVREASDHRPLVAVLEL